MNQNEANKLAANLVMKFGIGLTAVFNSKDGEDSVFLTPSDTHPNDTFQIHIKIGWRTLQFELLLGKFAGDFLNEMANVSNEKKQLFTNLVKHTLLDNSIISFKINDSVCDPMLFDTWPSSWKQFTFTVRKTPLEINTDNEELTEKLINTWSERFFGCVLALSPLEEINEFDSIQGLPEGAKSQVLVNKYERNRLNRAVCINFHAAVCKVCDFDFQKVYGNIGTGFIHVHHVTPVSRLGDDYVIDPIEDLVPVCPNCHSMLHRSDPPISIDGLKSILKSGAND
jgi:5-methylcytosine-specific restriction protein A